MLRDLFFDFDGTIADTTQGIIRCTQATLRELGLPASTPERIQATIGLPLRQCFALGTDTPEAQLDEAVAVYRRLFGEIATPCIVLYEGVAETLGLLYREGYRLSIATSRRGASLRMLLDRLGIGRFFVELATTEDVVHPKPAPDMVLLLLERLGARAEESLVIGDTVFDLQMGRGAGCRTCGVSYGNQTRSELASAAPDRIIDSFSALPDVLLQF